MTGFDRCQRAWDNMSPPEDSIEECPDCYGNIEAHDGGWRCTDYEDCGWSVYPDYDSPDGFDGILGDG